MLKFARIISKSETRYSKDVKAPIIPDSKHDSVAADQPSCVQVPDDVAMQKTIVLTDLKRHFQVIDTRKGKTANCQTPTFTVSIVVRDPPPAMASQSVNDDFYSSFEPIGNFEFDTNEECHQSPREVLQAIEEIPSITITQPDEEAENDSNPSTEPQPTIHDNGSSPPEVRPSSLDRDEVDVILCWTGPYIKQPHEQSILQSVQNAFLTKKKLEKEESELLRLTNEMACLQAIIQDLQHKLNSENLPFTNGDELERFSYARYRKLAGRTDSKGPEYFMCLFIKSIRLTSKAGSAFAPQEFNCSEEKVIFYDSQHGEVKVVTFSTVTRFSVQHKLHRQLKENLNRSTQLKQAVENQENDIKELAMTFDALMEEGRRQLEEHNS